ncbi:MAG: FAD synthetase family protein [Spirochaetaceae bacterium]|jgi:riboflavin kinase/FMN adenylyltransferase|nr:FAD synthetase family protein [Spirochaetaceae bacterium]
MRRINWDELSGLGQEAVTGGKKTALSVGVFDGLHRGHQALIAKITAKAPELLPAVVTFRQNPKVLVRGKTVPGGEAEAVEIIGFEEKMALLDNLGVALCVIIDFSEQFSRIDGRAFFEALNRNLHPAYVALGANFHCGYRRDTDAQGFKALAEGSGVEAELVAPVLEGGLPVSSSRIRSALEAGRTGEAALLLGRAG